ncbi:Carbamoyltransferase-domain-containing protein [Pelagophyceae sp. CCMP2097]|nr:Carbamoyltransferase-domain-containing protein [Pelagophyceae sp. CCMP2097]
MRYRGLLLLAAAARGSIRTVENACVFEGSVLLTATADVCVDVTVDDVSAWTAAEMAALVVCTEFESAGERAHGECRAFGAWPHGHAEQRVLAPGNWTASTWLADAADAGALVQSRKQFEHRVNFHVQRAPLLPAPRAPLRDAPAANLTLGVYLQHDANLALVRTADGFVIEALELERETRVRYFDTRHLSNAALEKVLSRSIDGLLRRAGESPRSIGYVAWVRNYASEHKVVVHELATRKFAPGVVWVECDHHAAHATLALYDSPFDRPLVVTLDGGGNDGLGGVFAAGRFPEDDDGAARAPLERVGDVTYDYGTAYTIVSTYASEVAGDWGSMTAHWSFVAGELGGPQPKRLALAGKAMGYSALGFARAEWLAPMRHFMRTHEGYSVTPPTPADFFAQFKGAGNVTRDGGESAQLRTERDLIATLQAVFVADVVALVAPYFLAAGAARYDGLALAGGCALNVLANTALQQTFGLRVHVPSSPNDGGLGVGAAWHVSAPLRRQPLQYTGAELFDAADVPRLLAPLPTRAVDVDALARFLVDGNIVAVVSGRAEFGPRALGHRSLLAYPGFDGAKARLNAVKFREAWRPCAPMVALDDALRVFTALPISPYMSFAATLTDAASAALPAISHYDGTARPQIVNSEDDAFLYALLLAVKRLTGWAVLINTSLNTRGRPILNTLLEALELYHTDDNLGALVVGDKVLYKDTLGAGGERGSPTREL